MDETWWGTQTEMFGPRNAHRVGLIFRELGELPPRVRVLEAAVGLGDVAERLRRDGHRVVGIDLSMEALLLARARTAAPLVVADITALPFRSEVFSVVSSAEKLEHLHDDAAAVRELARVVEPGGQIVITVPALEAFRTFSDDYYGHLRRYTRMQLVSLLRDAGFAVGAAHYWGFPFVVAYDYFFMLPLNRRRARRAVSGDAALQTVASLGRHRRLVGFVRRLFAIDRFFRWLPVGVGLVASGRRS